LGRGRLSWRLGSREDLAECKGRGPVLLLLQAEGARRP
jgi:hypothetical protein